MRSIGDTEWFGRLREDMVLETSWLGRVRVFFVSVARTFGVALAIALAVGLLVYFVVLGQPADR
jgi:hypothetical protein